MVCGAGCTFTDYNRDGFLDLFVGTYLDFDLKKVPLPGQGENCNWKGIPVNCGLRGLPTGRNFLYRNNGNGTFTDVSESSGIAKVDHRYAMTAVAADFDDDGWPDIYVACDSTPSILYKNNHDGTFTDIALEAGVAYNEDGREQAGMGVAIGDSLNSGRLDIFKTHFMDDTPILYANQGKGRFEDRTAKGGFGAFTHYIGWGAAFADFDNDGLLDLLFVNGSVYPEIEQYFKEYNYKNPRILLRNLGKGEFADVSLQCGSGITDRHSSRGCAFGDFDNDGRVDVLVMNMGEPPSLLQNQTANANHWLKLKLMGTKSNRTAIGARAFVSANGRRQRQEVLSQSSFYSQTTCACTSAWDQRHPPTSRSYGLPDSASNIAMLKRTRSSSIARAKRNDSPFPAPDSDGKFCAAQGCAALGEVRSYIHDSWKTLTRSNASLADSAIDSKVAQKGPGDSLGRRR